MKSKAQDDDDDDDDDDDGVLGYVCGPRARLPGDRDPHGP